VRGPRLLFVTDAPDVGGSEVYLRELLPPLRQLGYDAQVALPARPGTDALRAQIAASGVPVHAYTSLSELPGDFALYLLSSWNPRGHGKFYRALPGPFAAVVHDQLMLHVPGLPQAIYRAGYEWLQAGDLRRAGGVITVSRWGAEYLRAHHRLPHTWAVPNGVNEQTFRPASPEERTALRQKNGFGRFTVLVPARLSPEKNHFAVLATARRCPDLDFVLVGSGVLERPLKRFAPPNVRFLGRRDDMPGLYRAADVVFQPTIAENQSLATLEALASGTPVVTNDIPAQRELIAHGQNGLLIGTGPGGYAAALHRLAAQPELLEGMRPQARQSVLDGHTLRQNVQAFAAVLREVLAATGL
jgi:glycosyltransferase involved in cell wall biosynthesis